MRGRRRAFAAAGLVFAMGVGASVASAQSLSIGAGVSRGTLDEFTDADRHAGFGAGGWARLEGSRWSVEADASFASVSRSGDAESGSGDESLTLTAGSVHARYAVWRTLSAEVGFRSRSLDPEFVLQDAASASFGLHYVADLTSLAEVWVRGAMLPWSSFSGGGEAGVGVAVGMGLRVGRSDGRLRGVMSYGFDRLDRTVRGVDVPVQAERFDIGVEYAVF